MVRRKLKSRVKALKKALSTEKADVALSNEVKKRRDRLRIRIEDWRDFQKDLTPQIGDLVAQQAIEGKTANAPEEEILYIPSDFTEAKRIKYDLVKLGEHERHFLEGTAFDYISRVKTIMKSIFSSHADKKAQGYSQYTHTRATSQIEDIEERQNVAIADYSATRNAMISLGMSEHDPSFPPLSKQDTYRKPTHLKRAVGDSRRNDGAVWTAGVTGGTPHVAGSSSAVGTHSSLTITPPVITQAIRRKRKPLSYIHWAVRLTSRDFTLGQASQSEQTMSKGKKARVNDTSLTPEPTSTLAVNEEKKSKEGMALRLD